MFYASTKLWSKPLQESKRWNSQRLFPKSSTSQWWTLTRERFICVMGNLQKHLEKNNPFVITSIDRRTIILRKDSEHYTPKKNDRILSIDCVLANSDRLREIQEGIFELLWVGIFYFSCRGLPCFGLCLLTCSAWTQIGKLLRFSHLQKWHRNRGPIFGIPLIVNELSLKKR